MRGAKLLISTSENKVEAILKVDYEIKEVIKNLNYVKSSSDICDLELRIEQLNEDFKGLSRLRNGIINN